MASLHLAQEILNIIYPVGSIYISVNSTNPSTYFGGTWTAISDRFLLGNGSTYKAGSIGGSANHYHLLPMGYYSGSTGINYKVFDSTWGQADGKHKHNVKIGNWRLKDPDIAASTNTCVQDTSNSVSNMPPYLVVYIWKRTA